VLAYCALEFPGAEFADVDDPAGDQRAQTDGRSCRMVLGDKGIVPSGGEVSTKGRLEALAGLLTKTLSGGRPAVLVDAGKCPMLADGLKGGYRFAEVGQTGRYNYQPEKNQYSHPMNCAEYVASRLRVVTPRSPDDHEDDYKPDAPRRRASRYY
jgi:hypothetical protein